MYDVLHAIDLGGCSGGIVLFQVTTSDTNPHLSSVRVGHRPLGTVEIDTLEGAGGCSVIALSFVGVSQEFLESCILVCEGGDAWTEKLDGGLGNRYLDIRAKMRHVLESVTIDKTWLRGSVVHAHESIGL